MMSNTNKKLENLKKQYEGARINEEHSIWVMEDASSHDRIFNRDLLIRESDIRDKHHEEARQAAMQIKALVGMESGTEVLHYIDMDVMQYMKKRKSEEKPVAVAKAVAQEKVYPASETFWSALLFLVLFSIVWSIVAVLLRNALHIENPTLVIIVKLTPIIGLILYGVFFWQKARAFLYHPVIRTVIIIFGVLLLLAVLSRGCR